MLLAGLVDGDGPDAYGTTVAETPDQSRAVIEAYKSAGFVQMKLYSRLAPDVVVAIARHAHELGMTVTGHIPNLLTVQQAVQLGMDPFEHLPIRGESGSPEVREVVQFLAERGTVAIPTLAWDELLGRAPGAEISNFEPGLLEAPAPIASSYQSVTNDIDSSRASANRRRGLLIVKALHDAGVTILAGTART